MRKWLASLGYTIIILIAAFSLLPLLMGILAEKKCTQIADVINTTTPFTVKITDYHRGWFGADATAQISLDKLELPNKQLHQVTINAHITHGPVLIDWARFQFAQAMIKADINLNADQNNLLKRAPNAEPIATTKIKFKLNGNTSVILDSPPLAYQDQENKLLWQGLKIKSDFSHLYNQVKSKIDFAGIDITIKDYNFRLGEATITHQGNKTSDGLWIGERNLKFSSFSTKNPNNRITAFEGVNIHILTTSDQKNSADISTNLIINNLNINGATYSQNNLEFELNKLSQPLLVKLQQQLTSGNIISSQTTFGFDTVLAILGGGGEINIKQLETNTPWGKLIANIKIIFANQQNNSGFLATIAGSTINTIIKTERALVLHLLEKFYQSISSQKELNNPLKQAETLLNEWQQSGKITTSDQDHYLHMVFDYKNGMPSINNKQLILTTKL